jgi:hypothetical protein
MNSISLFVIWICSKFTRDEIERIRNELGEILANRNPEIKPKDDFKELLKQYLKQHCKPLKPVIPKKSETKVTKDTRCPNCSTLTKHLYFKDGKKSSQNRYPRASPWNSALRA